MRYTGCFKVQCSRCNTCMCFKCPAGDMAFYDNPRDCYDHLNEIHGGYHWFIKPFKKVKLIII